MSYKVWMTQGQGFDSPEAETDTLEEALEAAKSMFGEGSVAIELPDRFWYKFGPEWDVPVKVTLLRMRKDDFNPRQQFIYNQWEKACFKSTIKKFQTGGHTFKNVWSEIYERLGLIKAQELFFESLFWGLFDVFEFSSSISATDNRINKIINK